MIEKRMKQIHDNLVSANDEIERLKQDRLTLALRLYGEDFSTFSPETREVMHRMVPEIQKIFRR